MKRTFAFAAALGAAAFIAGPAFAHTGYVTDSGLVRGFVHPLAGLDHLAAMLAVGIWSAMAARNDGRLWLAPLAFVVTMIAGAALGIAGMALPAVEPGIAASVLVLGLLVATRHAPSGTAGALLIAVFAVFHGHAHGIEATGSVAAFVAGFGAATAALHLAGIGLGNVLMRVRLAVPVTGAAIAATGAWLLGT